MLYFLNIAEAVVLLELISYQTMLIVQHHIRHVVALQIIVAVIEVN